MYGNRMSTLNNQFEDYRVLFSGAMTAGQERQVPIDSELNFGRLESVLAVQLDGAVGDITIGGKLVSALFPTPHKVTANILNITCVNAASICVFVQKLSPQVCPKCGSCHG